MMMSSIQVGGCFVTDAVGADDEVVADVGVALVAAVLTFVLCGVSNSSRCCSYKDMSYTITGSETK